jgi:hypothetical protein
VNRPRLGVTHHVDYTQTDAALRYVKALWWLLLVRAVHRPR